MSFRFEVSIVKNGREIFFRLFLPKSWLKSISAFANTKGGALIFGVSDDEVLVGLENYKRDSEIISENIKEKIDPFLEFDMV